jgi:hypothetical protein
MIDYQSAFLPLNDLEVSAEQCPAHFVQLLNDLMNFGEGAWKVDQEIANLELDNFIEEKINLRISSIFGHVERLLKVVQAFNIVGPNIVEEIELSIAKDDDYIFWDPAAYGVWLDESEYGSLLSLQELPEIAYHFMVKAIEKLKLSPSASDPVYEFKEGYLHLSPSDITKQFGRLLKSAWEIVDSHGVEINVNLDT